MNKVRAKFRLEQIQTLQGRGYTQTKYIFDAVCDDGTPENQRFAKYTPSGRFEMVIDNPSAQAMFIVGECYYFDASPVSDPVSA